MALSDPSPQQTLALVLGASSFRRAPKLAQGRAFNNSAQDFNQYLIAPDGLGMPGENVNWMFDDSRSPSDQLQDIRDFLETRTAELTRKGTPPQDLILYYVGHGLFSGSDQTYCLAIRSTDERSEGLTSIRAADLASIIKSGARFLRKFLIFDCCFSSAAYREFQSSPLTAGRVKLLDELPAKGTTMLCSASAQDPSLAPDGISRTMFSDGLLGALQQGHPLLGPRLSLSELGDLIKARLKDAYPDTWVRPEVHSPDQREGDVGGVCLFPNPAFAAPAPQPVSTPRKEQIFKPPETFVEKPPAAADQESQNDRFARPQVHAVVPDENAIKAPPAEAAAEPHSAMPAEPKSAPEPRLDSVPAALPESTEAIPDQDTEPEVHRGFFRNRQSILSMVGIVAALALGAITWYVSGAPQRKIDLAATLLSQGEHSYSYYKFDEAAADIRQSLALNPNIPVAHLDLGLALREQGNFPGAIDEFHKALSLMEGYHDPKIYYDLALAYYMQGNFAGARAAFLKVITTDSPNGFVLAEPAYPHNHDPATVVIAAYGGLSIGSTNVGSEGLGALLNSIYGNRAEKMICLAPDYLNAYSNVQAVARIARNAGLDTLCIVPPGKGAKID